MCFFSITLITDINNNITTTFTATVTSLDIYIYIDVEVYLKEDPEYSRIGPNSKACNLGN